MTIVTFFVRGDPQPQGSHRAFVVKGRAVVTETNKRTRPWRDIVAAEGIEARGDTPTFTGAVRVDLTFHLSRPKSVKRLWPTVKPDADKLIRAVLDALTIAGIVSDDAIVTTILARKRYANEYGEAGVDVAVYPDSDI